MLLEQGTVVAVEADAIWVETVRASTCGACKAKAGCGHHLVNQQQSGQRAHLRVPVSSRESHQVGDTVQLALPEGALMRGALWVYRDHHRGAGGHRRAGDPAASDGL